MNSQKTIDTPREVTEFPSAEAVALLATDVDFAAWKRLQGERLDEDDVDALKRARRLLSGVAEFNMPNGSGHVFLTGSRDGGKPLVDTLQTIHDPSALVTAIDRCLDDAELSDEAKAVVRELRKIFGLLAERMLARANSSLAQRG